MSDSGVDTVLIERRIAAIGTKVDQMTTKVDKVESQMEEVRKDLKKLRKDFLEMMLEQRRTAALEQATTELVSVRQEMDKSSATTQWFETQWSVFSRQPMRRSCARRRFRRSPRS